MKVVILAGGYGTRLSEETALRPKPMVEIGGKPILWHIMKLYSAFGVNEFIICCGYNGFIIKEYFANYALHLSDVTFDLTNRTAQFHSNASEPWKVTLVDTGSDTQTGGRIKRIQKYIADETFLVTYGDGIGDVNIPEAINHHRRHQRLATITTVQPPGRFGSVDFDSQNRVTKFAEKPKGDGGWVSAGFFVLEPEVLNYIDGDHTSFEQDTLKSLVQCNQVSAYRHDGFWQAMDTLRDCQSLNQLWASGNAPWNVWSFDAPVLAPSSNPVQVP